MQQFCDHMVILLKMTNLLRLATQNRVSCRSLAHFDMKVSTYVVLGILRGEKSKMSTVDTLMKKESKMSTVDTFSTTKAVPNEKHFKSA